MILVWIFFGTRSYEFLQMYLLPEVNGRVKEQNRATLAAAEAIKSQRIIDLTNSKAGIRRAKGWQRLLLSDWLEIYVEKKKEEGRKNISAYRSMAKVIIHSSGYSLLSSPQWYVTPISAETTILMSSTLSLGSSSLRQLAIRRQAIKEME